jgi:hypothetical protein
MFRVWVNTGEQYNWLSQLRIQGTLSNFELIDLYTSVPTSVDVVTTGVCDGGSVVGVLMLPFVHFALPIRDALSSTALEPL